MPNLSFRLAGSAVLLFGLTAPTLAIEVPLYSLDTGVVVASDTGAYDAWAAECPNVQGGSSCDYSDLETIRADDSTLFFWGDAAGNPKNTSIALSWQGDTDSDPITSVRILSLTADDQSQAAVMGPSQGPKDLDLPFPLSPGTTADFLNGSVAADRPGSSLGATQAQGSRIFHAYGRATSPFAPSAQESLDAVLPGFLSPEEAPILSARVSVPGATSVDIEVAPALFTANLYVPVDGASEPNFEIITSSAKPLSATPSVNADGNLGGAGSGALGSDEALTLELYNDQVPVTKTEDFPTAYMDDVIVVLNQTPTTGPEAGMDLRGLPSTDDFALDYERTGDTLTATLAARAGTDDLDGLTYRVFNQGTSGPIGDGSTGSYTQAVTSGDGDILNLSADAATASLEVGEVTGERGFDYQVRDLTLADTGGFESTLTQQITDNGAAVSIQEIVGQTVGPILGVTPDGVVSSLPYDDVITFDPVDAADACATSGSGCPFRNLKIANVFDADLGDLTDLTIANIGIDGADAGAFDILSRPTLTDPVAGGTVLGDLKIEFSPGVGSNRLFDDAFLFFDTDMNRGLGTTTNRLRFWLEGERTASGGAVPGPSVLALFALGLVGLACVNSRRQRRRAA